MVDKVVALGEEADDLDLEIPQFKRTPREEMQWGLALGMLILFGLTICSTFAMIFLNGLGITQIPNNIVIALVGATISQTGGMLILILQSVFGKVTSVTSEQ